MNQKKKEKENEIYKLEIVAVELQRTRLYFDCSFSQF